MPSSSSEKKKSTNKEYSQVELLQKKIKKVQKFLKKQLRVDPSSPSSKKEYRAYQRKLKSYQQQLEALPEYKEARLSDALNDLRSLTSGSGSSVDLSKYDDDESSSSSSSSNSSTPSIDYEMTVKKYDKVTRLIETEQQESSKAKFVKKQAEYLQLLEQCDEWKEESYRRMEHQAREEAKARALKEQEEELQQQKQQAEQLRQHAQAELELQKEAARAQVRAKLQAQEQKEAEKELAYRQAQKLEQQTLLSPILSQTQALALETQERERDMEASLQEQEDKGMILRR